jgi:hypothetical protein
VKVILRHSKSQAKFIAYFYLCKLKSKWGSGNPPTQEEEIRRIMFENQPGQIVCETLSRKNPSQKCSGGAIQGVRAGFKPLCRKNTTSTKQPPQT